MGMTTADQSADETVGRMDYETVGWMVGWMVVMLASWWGSGMAVLSAALTGFVTVCSLAASLAREWAARKGDPLVGERVDWTAVSTALKTAAMKAAMTALKTDGEMARPWVEMMAAYLDAS